MRRIKETVNQVRTEKTFEEMIRSQLQACLDSEIKRVLRHFENQKRGVRDIFSPLFDFSKQTDVIFGVDVSNRQSSLRNSYYTKLLVMKITLQSVDLVTAQDEFISMTTELLKIMNSNANQAMNDIKALVEQFNQSQQKPRAKKEKPWMTKLSQTVGDFDLAKLHRLASTELERIKKLYLRYINDGRGEVKVWKDKILEAHKLGGILQIYPERENTESIENFLLAVQYFLENFSEASKAILVRALEPGVTKYNGFSDDVKKSSCLVDFNKLATNKGQIAKMLGKETDETSTPRMFQPRPPTSDNPSLTRKSTEIFRRQ